MDISEADLVVRPDEEEDLMAELYGIMGGGAPAPAPKKNHKEQLMEKIAAKKTEALTLKRAGDKTAAIAALREAKSLEAELASVVAKQQMAATQRELNPDDVTVTEADMNDPVLLAGVTITGMPAEPEPPPAASPPPPPPPTPRSSAPTPSDKCGRGRGDQAKGSGDKSLAVAKLREVKSLEAVLKELSTSPPSARAPAAAAPAAVEEVSDPSQMSEEEQLAWAMRASMAGATTSDEPHSNTARTNGAPVIEMAAEAEADDEMAILMASMNEPTAPRGDDRYGNGLSIDDESDLIGLVDAMQGAKPSAREIEEREKAEAEIAPDMAKLMEAMSIGDDRRSPFDHSGAPAEEEVDPEMQKLLVSMNSGSEREDSPAAAAPGRPGSSNGGGEQASGDTLTKAQRHLIASNDTAKMLLEAGVPMDEIIESLGPEAIAKAEEEVKAAEEEEAAARAKAAAAATERTTPQASPPPTSSADADVMARVLELKEEALRLKRAGDKEERSQR